FAELDYAVDAQVHQAVELLLADRLLVSGRNALGQPYVEPAHGDLIANWDLLGSWIAEAQELLPLQLQQQLWEAAALWDQTQPPRSPGRLWTDNPDLGAVANALTKAR